MYECACPEMYLPSNFDSVKYQVNTRAFLCKEHSEMYSYK